jgi:hypothetical protein
LGLEENDIEIDFSMPTHLSADQFSDMYTIPLPKLLLTPNSINQNPFSKPTPSGNAQSEV